MGRPTNTNHERPALPGVGVAGEGKNPFPVASARITWAHDATEASVGHDDQMLALLVMVMFGAGRTTGNDPASPLADVFET